MIGLPRYLDVSMVYSCIAIGKYLCVLQVLYGGVWIKDAGYTPGEEDEQIFSYLSRIGATTKYMLPERKYCIDADTGMTFYPTYINMTFLFRKTRDHN